MNCAIYTCIYPISAHHIFIYIIYIYIYIIYIYIYVIYIYIYYINIYHIWHNHYYINTIQHMQNQHHVRCNTDVFKILDLRAQQRYLHPRHGPNDKSGKLEVGAWRHYAVSWLLCDPLDRARHCDQPHQHPSCCDPRIAGSTIRSQQKLQWLTAKSVVQQTSYVVTTVK